MASASNFPGLALAKPDYGRMARATARAIAKADKAVYAHVSDRDGLRCRACGEYGGIDIHRHHLRGKKFTTREDVCCICDECHDKMHVRVGGKTLKIYGNAEVRNRYNVPNGLTIEMRQQDGTWLAEAGR